MKRRFFSLYLVVFFCCLLIASALNSIAEDKVKELPAPQLVTDAWMLLIGYEADPEVIRSLLPPGLEPHPNSMIVMNMYTVPDPSQTSGFGAYTLTYLTIQLKGQDSYIMGSETGEPGRYFVAYFNSSEVMRNFTRKVGIPAEPGMTKQTKKNGKLVSVLEVDGKPFIEATVDVSEELQPAVGGHLNYFGLKKINRDSKEVLQIMKYPIPFVVRTVKTENPKVEFKMPEDHPLYRLKPINVKWASYMKGSFVYPQAQVLKEVESK